MVQWWPWASQVAGKKLPKNEKLLILLLVTEQLLTCCRELKKITASDRFLMFSDFYKISVKETTDIGRDERDRISQSLISINKTFTFFRIILCLMLYFMINFWCGNMFSIGPVLAIVITNGKIAWKWTEFSY